MGTRQAAHAASMDKCRRTWLYIMYNETARPFHHPTPSPTLPAWPRCSWPHTAAGSMTAQKVKHTHTHREKN